MIRTSKRSFVTLDGLRGIAALAIVTRHAIFVPLPGAESPTSVGPFFESYLAVDFFRAERFCPGSCLWAAPSGRHVRAPLYDAEKHSALSSLPLSAGDICDSRFETIGSRRHQSDALPSIASQHRFVPAQRSATCRSDEGIG